MINIKVIKTTDKAFLLLVNHSPPYCQCLLMRKIIEMFQKGSVLCVTPVGYSSVCSALKLLNHITRPTLQISGATL